MWEMFIMIVFFISFKLRLSVDSQQFNSIVFIFNFLNFLWSSFDKNEYVFLNHLKIFLGENSLVWTVILSLSVVPYLTLSSFEILRVFYKSGFNY